MNKRIKAYLIYFFMSPCMLFFVGMFGLFDYINPHNKNIYQTMIWLLKFIGLTVLFRVDLLDEMKRLPIKRNIYWIIKYIMIMIFVQIAILYTREYLHIQHPSQASSIVRDKTLMSVLIGSFIAPFIEEIIFRKCIFESTKQFGIGIQMVASSAIFAMVHSISYGMIFFLIYFFMSLVFALSYARSKNIFVPIVVHSGLNLMIQVAVIVN